jgi:hypothetical protein
MSEPVWRKYPPARPRKYDWDVITETLRGNPGEWLLIDEEATVSLATAITRKKMVALRSDTWEYKVKTVNNDHLNNRAEVWMSAERKGTHVE